MTQHIQPSRLLRLAALLSIAVLSQCSSPSNQIIKSYPATDPSHVAVLHASPAQVHEVLGMISAHGSASGSFESALNRALTKLKIDAARVGADAVILSGPVTQTQTMFSQSLDDLWGTGQPPGDSTNRSGTTTSVGAGANDAELTAQVIRYIRK